MSGKDQDDARRLRYTEERTARVPKQLQAGLLGFIMITGLAGCTQGEEVFLRQNRASAALAYTILDIETTAPDAVDDLYDAEQELAQACAPLQEAGARGIRQEEIGLGLRLEILGALDHCETVSTEVEALVWRTDPEIARTYLDVSTLASVSAE